MAHYIAQLPVRIVEIPRDRTRFRTHINMAAFESPYTLPNSEQELPLPAKHATHGQTDA